MEGRQITWVSFPRWGFLFPVTGVLKPPPQDAGVKATGSSRPALSRLGGSEEGSWTEPSTPDVDTGMTRGLLGLLSMALESGE